MSIPAEGAPPKGDPALDRTIPLSGGVALDEIRAVLGRLRESLAAAQNLGHLTSSRIVGPKVVGDLLPDVAELLARFPDEVRELLARLGLLQRVENQPSLLSDLVCSDLPSLEAELRRAGAGPARAKTRLSIERQVAKVAPQMQASVEHLRLLVESAAGGSVVLSVHELLSLAPELGAAACAVSVGGELNLAVAAPVRIALSSLAAWVAASAIRQEVVSLKISEREDRVVFEMSGSSSSQELYRLPLFPATAHSERVVRLALQPYGGSIGGGTFALPRATTQSFDTP